MTTLHLVDICIRNQYGYVPYSDELDMFLSQILTVKYNHKIRDYFNSPKGKPPKFITVEKFDKLYDVVQLGDSYVIRILRSYIEFLPDDTFNKIYADTSDLNIPSLTSDEIKHILPQYELRDDQVMATVMALYKKRGILQLPTGSGKTVILSAILKILCDNNPDKSFIVVAPANQIVRNINKTLVNNGVDSVILNKNDQEFHQVTVSHIMSLVKDYSESKLRNCSGIFYDECQHVSSNSYQSIVDKFDKCEYSLGFSALVVDPDHVYSNNIHDYGYSELKIIGAVGGKVLMYSPPSEYVEQGILATPVLLRINTEYESDDSVDWHYINKRYMMSDYRNRVIAHTIYQMYKLKRKVLILVSTKNQGMLIMNYLSEYPDVLRSVGVSYGGNVGYTVSYEPNGTVPFDLISEEGFSVIDKFNDGKLTILFGTTHLDEGADISQLDACILAGGGKNPRRVIQRVGRALRISKSGKYAYIIDFVDNGQVVLSQHSRSRLVLYINEIGVTQENLYLSIDENEIESRIRMIEGM